MEVCQANSLSYFCTNLFLFAIIVFNFITPVKMFFIDVKF